MNRPTMEDVAARAGVSRGLVSLVINNAPNVSAARREAVLEAARELGYRPNLLARNLAQQRTRTLGVVVNQLHNPFFTEIVDAIDAAAEDHDLDLLMLSGGHQGQREQRCVERFLQYHVEGLVLIGSTLDSEQLKAAARLVPTVVVAGGHPEAAVDSIQTDDRRGGEIAVEHLVALGHRHIAHIDGSPNRSAEPRRQGYIEAMRSADLEPSVIAGGDDETAAVAALEPVLALRPRPTAVFAFNDLLAAGVLDGLDDLGLRVPDDLALIGYDNTFIAKLHHLSITTIDQPTQELGGLAVTTLLERIEGGRSEPVHHVLEPSLVTRATTKP